MQIILKLLLVVLCLGNASAWASDNVQEQLNRMTLEEKVAQLFFVRPEALRGCNDFEALVRYEKGVTRVTRDMREGLKKYPVGGVVLFGKNIVNPEQTRKMLKALREASDHALILAIDEEGGPVARIANNPSMQVSNVGPMCKVDSRLKAYIAGYRIGKYLKDYDLDMNFAPVADVLVNPENKLVNKRSFGEEAQLCGEYAQAYIEGLHTFGIMSTVKHFPGHGGWEQDSHTGLSESAATLEELRSKEFVSFKKALAGKTEAVMIAHIVFPNITTDKTPASLNKFFITELLKEEFSFKGLIITDSLAMDAIAKYYGYEEAAVRALKAGADVLLMPGDLARAHKGVVEAVQKGEIPQERLDEAVKKQLYYKLKN